MRLLWSDRPPKERILQYVDQKLKEIDEVPDDKKKEDWMLREALQQEKAELESDRELIESSDWPIRPLTFKYLGNRVATYFMSMKDKGTRDPSLVYGVIARVIEQLEMMGQGTRDYDNLLADLKDVVDSGNLIYDRSKIRSKWYFDLLMTRWGEYIYPKTLHYLRSVYPTLWDQKELNDVNHDVQMLLKARFVDNDIILAMRSRLTKDFIAWFLRPLERA